jgi:1,4-dihydroxy-6-naphthoate synthase
LKLSLGFSPCPNDTFIFDALVNNKIDTEGIVFDTVLEDVETLNQLALQEKLDITKLSFPAFFKAIDNYILLNSGGALGKGVGPLLISKSEVGEQQSEVGSRKSEVDQSTIVLPGENTTANLLFSFAYPEAFKKVFMRFDLIEDFVLNESSKVSPPKGGGPARLNRSGGDLEGAKGSLGVIIHENRFTYQQKGLHKVTDLGEYWEKTMKLPVPLGGIAVKRSIDRLKSLKIENLIRKSLEYAFSNYPIITDYVKQHSQEMNEDVMRQHIDLYVNNFSLDLGDAGKKAISVLYDTWLTISKTASTSAEIFLS